jgi:geranylgeranyl pyrophosphate synthase
MNTADDSPWKGIPSFRCIQAPLAQVNLLIHQSLAAYDAQAEPAPLLDLLGRCCGPLLRPGLVLLAGECFGTLHEDHFRVAAMMEMMHHATLLHDEVLDEGSRPRGGPATRAVGGNEPAVLWGDLLLSQIFRMAAELDPPVAKILAQTAARVCEGQLRQAIQQHNWQIGEAQYLEIVAEKSASFFGGCCRLGATLAGAPEPQIESLARFGLLAGMAFHVAEELPDLTGRDHRTDRPAPVRPTLAVIHLLRTVEAPRRARVRAILEASGESRRELGALLERCGSLQYARTRAADFLAQALGALEEVPSCQAKEALLETARFLVNRAV